MKSFRGIVEIIPSRLTQHMVVGENMDILSIHGAEHVPVVREDTEEVVRQAFGRKCYVEVGTLSNWAGTK